MLLVNFILFKKKQPQVTVLIILFLSQSEWYAIVMELS